MKTVARLLIRKRVVSEQTMIVFLFRVFNAIAAIKSEARTLRWYAIITILDAKSQEKLDRSVKRHVERYAESDGCLLALDCGSGPGTWFTIDCNKAWTDPRPRASSDRTESLMRFTGPIKML